MVKYAREPSVVEEDDFPHSHIVSGKATRSASGYRHGGADLAGKSMPTFTTSSAHKNALYAATSSSWTRPYEAFDILTRARAAQLAEAGQSLDVGITTRRISLSDKNQADLLSILETNEFKLVARDMSPPWRESPLFDRTAWYGPNGVILITAVSGEDVGTDLTVASHSAFIQNLISWWDERAVAIPHDTGSGRVSGVFVGRNGVEIREFRSSIGWPLEPLNYSPAVQNFYHDIVAELTSPTPRGRLAILDGRPGMGKTYLIRALVHDLHAKVSFIYLPASMVSQLDGPQMLSLIEEDRYSRDPRPRVLIIEDADECLVSRAADNMSSIRSVLNFCDGFLGAMLDIRILATTNSGHVGRTDKIDPALLRPGRLIRKETLSSLNVDEVNLWLASRNIPRSKELPEAVSLAELYAFARRYEQSRE